MTNTTAAAVTATTTTRGAAAFARRAARVVVPPLLRSRANDASASPRLRVGAARERARLRLRPRLTRWTVAASASGDDGEREENARDADADADANDEIHDESESRSARTSSRSADAHEAEVAAADAAREAAAAAAVAAKREALLEASEPLPWAGVATAAAAATETETDAETATETRTFRGDSLEDAASFLSWRVLDANTGEEIGIVKHALGMAGGEVIAQVGDECDERDERDDDDDDDADDDDDDDDDFFSPSATAVEDERDDDDDDWEVIYEGAASGDGGDDDEWDGDEEDDDEDAGEAEEGSRDDDDDDAEADGAPPPMSLVLRIAGARAVAGAGGAINALPVTHLVPLVPSIFPRWDPSTSALVMDPPEGLLDLGIRQSEIRALRRDLLPYCARVNATELGMPSRRTLMRSGREDLATRVAALGDSAAAAVTLGFTFKRKPDGYWENIDFLRDALLQLTHAFWFEEMDEESEEIFWYNDISGALSFEPPTEASGGGLDAPVMPSVADVLEARRYDVHHAILLHGGYKEVAGRLGWMQKRTSENRHLLQFATLRREMLEFLEEAGEELDVPPGRLPTAATLTGAGREDLVQGVKWHGGFVRVARRLGLLNSRAAELTDVAVAAAAFRDFARAHDVPALHDGARIMPTNEQLIAHGRHDMRWALRIHDRASIVELAGLHDPNAANPNTGGARKRRLKYDDARRYMREKVNDVAPPLTSARRFREWCEAGRRPWFIPALPSEYYSKRGEWRGWDDFLGAPERPRGLRRRSDRMKSYEDARTHMRTLRDAQRGGDDDGAGAPYDPSTTAPRTSSEYKRWVRAGYKPEDIPYDPVLTYGKRRGDWRGWDDFLGREPGWEKTRAGRRRGRAKAGSAA